MLFRIDPVVPFDFRLTQPAHVIEHVENELNQFLVVTRTRVRAS